MTRTLARCPVEGCPRTKSSGHLMCREDWRRVSKPTQNRVYRTWRAVNGLDMQNASVEQVDAAWAAYRSARDEAIREAEAA